MTSTRFPSDARTPAARSALMRSVRQKDTSPELSVRRFVHASGLRYRLHVRALPGTPDLVFPRHRTVVFVHGCFWHGHSCRHGRVAARTNSQYWSDKIAENRRRDRRKRRRLERLGWRVIEAWECRAEDAKYLHRLVQAIRKPLHRRAPGRG